MTSVMLFCRNRDVLVLAFLFCLFLPLSSFAETDSTPSVETAKDKDKITSETPSSDSPAKSLPKEEPKVIETPKDFEKLDDCIACGKSVDDLKKMGLSQDEINDAVKKKLDRLNRLSEERRKRESESGKVDLTKVKDCIACGVRGKDLKAKGLSPEEIRAAYKDKFKKLKKIRDKNLKKIKTQRLSVKIQEAYHRQKKNQKDQFLAEQRWLLNYQKVSKDIKPVAKAPDLKAGPKPPEGMLFIPPGPFVMGQDWGVEDVQPMRAIELSAFFMDRTEVKLSGFREWITKRNKGKIPFYLKDNDLGGDNQPAFKVSWMEAKLYCESLEKRLPTEAEWEKAARGWDNRYFPWGNELPDAEGRYRANYNPGAKIEDGYRYTSKVNSFVQGVSPYGILNMSGNLWEWTSDWYDKDYYQKGELNDPQGPQKGTEKVLRGGAYNTPVRRLLLTTRLKERPGAHAAYVGFRCAQSMD